MDDFQAVCKTFELACFKALHFNTVLPGDTATARLCQAIELLESAIEGTKLNPEIGRHFGEQNFSRDK